MNLLLIDNGTSFLQTLERSLTDCEISVIAYSSITNDHLEKADLIVLSGGHGYPVVHHENEYTKELQLIRGTFKPIIGICLGFELIVYAFGGELELMKMREKGELQISLTKPIPLFGNTTTITVFESHRWSVKQLPENLEILATSKDGIEIIKHKMLPIIGFQFHPEMNFTLSASQLFNTFRT